MNFSKLIETLLFRDLLSYALPGGLILLLFTQIPNALPTITLIMATAKKVLGDVGLSALILGLCYVVGYIGSTGSFYLRGVVFSLRKRKALLEIRPEVMEQLNSYFGQWTAHADLRYLAGLCLHVIQAEWPEIYFEKIERRVTLRNMEIGLAAMFVATAVVLGVIALIHASLFIVSFSALLIAISFLVSSVNLDKDIDNLAFGLFLALRTSKGNRAETEKNSDKRIKYNYC